MGNTVEISLDVEHRACDADVEFSILARTCLVFQCICSVSILRAAAAQADPCVHGPPAPGVWCRDCLRVRRHGVMEIILRDANCIHRMRGWRLLVDRFSVAAEVILGSLLIDSE